MIKTSLIQGVIWIPSTGQLANCLTKRGADRKYLMKLFKK